MSKKIADNFISSEDVAKLFNLDVRRIQQLTKENIITGKKVKNAYKYNLYKIVSEYIKYLTDKTANKIEQRKSSELETDKLKAETELKEAKAEMAKLELEELKNNLHRAEDVEDMTMDIVLNIRSMLLALPGLLAVELVSLKTTAEISNKIKIEIHKILDELSEYKYDPNEYKKRIRERQGWTLNHEEDE